NSMVYATVGIHPHNAKDASRADLLEIMELARDKRVVAWGEIGLDFFKNYSPKREQISIFMSQLEVADELNLPVVIHERNAREELYSILVSRGKGEYRGVIHCFSEDLAYATRFIELGFFISIPGIVTFKRAEGLKEVAQKIPISSMLLETDAPFLAPEPFRGKTNEPSYLIWTAKEVARLKNISLEELANETTLNAKRLFGIQLPI
ncbi:MAG: TatD family hydrolase, partial [Desulfatiglandales bacterium]